ncbi:NUDIX hydrolase [Streptomyces litchfieldiae]|uniref:NUDIX domain-containing protein n=1 Tax=Streptomyces litchfieldiae TaxID=3075543 RepID=A0ABU2MUM6_9ACTN|nr:NUDIX domain-containing protein [Streptomyces sp. DSM 44938]MDT0345351.1 NUDIX domain-containing protein [Streptomyces sp. DSM 44938]
MAITPDHIRETVDEYLEAHPDEKRELGPVLDLLDAGADLTSRKEFRGHATAGAILADPDGRVLHIHHLALDRWLLPGGHLEADDSRLVDAARRELTEETGIPVSVVVPAGPRPLHIDVHPIPANDAKGEPEHQHVDFRFLFRTTSADVGELQTEEVTAAAWRDAGTIADETLRSRVMQALR